MKKIIIAAFALAVTSSAFAQISKGSLFLGLDLGFGSDNTEYSATNPPAGPVISSKYKASYWNLGPTAQYFLADNFALGLGISVGRNKSRNDYPQNGDWNESEQSNTSINLFGRKYFNCSETFYTYGELNLGIMRGKGESRYYQAPPTDDLNVFKNENGSTGAAINIGFAWMATPRVMMHGGFGVLGFNSYRSKYNIQDDGDYQEYKGSELNFSLSTGNIPFNLGFAYLLNGGGD
jgi:hypothetical protein